MKSCGESFAGLVVRADLVEKFVIKKCPEKHSGRGRALINYNKRNGAKRFEIVRITAPDGRYVRAAVVGHYDDANFIKLDYDMRDLLGVNLDQEIDLEVRRCGLIDSFLWYVLARDPMIKIPARLTIVSLFLGILSVFLTFF